MKSSSLLDFCKNSQRYYSHQKEEEKYLVKMKGYIEILSHLNPGEIYLDVGCGEDLLQKLLALD